ncbi:TrbG/VirB9 family P-type conjugative transfer protein [Burkholderia multivorans]|uniref:TrbG/VirB9 family P-type conjugative transfer protein n=1 Tax=Burkholderia multivorans TaxID=87883 RepID=UPI000CFE3DA0|nr:TrbG/VirB9 family P-type conjugative transfer protein [Burkholderia multivorans]MBU9122937.1 TrbG/VirB9 family P-type conjugative transfer protein [Burkholderia multivorans]MDN7867559.1 TrbG/VirB9 family P-type conjugative transfer protein [Burkholderia multivorans]MDR8920786.1 Type IV secretion system protein virB9 [Burkholderia multivorans]MDR8926867.1 Type IV secretion system protein virB9 [Burkholderia multivorans]MDR8969228.1 Type IV secretion system protein virB9 [Burkholderia multivo
MKLRALFVCVALAAPLPALAVQQTHPSPADARIRFIDYDPYNVPTIYARIGGDLLIVFQNGEVVKDMGGGDTDAWGVGVSTAGNSVFMKPKVTSPNMNLHVITNKRIYSIDLKLAGKGQTAYQTIFYRYPDDERAKRDAANQRTLARDLLNAGAATVKNRNYTMQGADALAPLEAWDDGTFTYFRFPANRDVPSVYYVDDAGKEHLVNKDMNANYVLTVQKIAKKFVFRSGDIVTCIFNESYNPNAERSPTNTTSPNVERVIKGGQ